MRVFAVVAVLLVFSAACGSRSAPEQTSASSRPGLTSNVQVINPARIERVRQELPPGYEVVGIDPHANPVSLWGFGPDWTAVPSECAAQAAREVEPGRGWSASGPGGIVYAAVAKLGPGVPPELDRDQPSCDEWSVSGGHAAGIVTPVAAPVIEGVVTAGMATAVTTVVEGGTETRSHADTFTADLDGGYHVFVTVVTDPGSPAPALGSEFASDLLVKTVSALRG